MSLAAVRASGLTRGLARLWREPLHRNSFVIIASQGLGAVIGFAFWWLAARLFTPSEVGLALALISAATLVATLSLLGYDVGIVRYYPLALNKRSLVNTYLTVAGIISFLAAVVYVAGLGIWSPELLLIRDRWSHTAAFIGFTCLMTVGLLQSESFIAMRKPALQLVQNSFSAVKLVALPLVAAAGVFGIFYVWGATTVFLLITGVFLLMRFSPGYRPFPAVDRATVRNTMRYTFGNYMAKNLDSLPANIMPLLILSFLAVADSAFFYYPYRISALLGTVIWSVSAALLAESSHNPGELRSFVIKAVAFAAFILVPLALVIVLTARPILSIFGAEYASPSGVSLLRLFTLSWLPGSLNIIYVTVARVQMKTRPLIMVYGTLALLIIGGSLLAMRLFGLVGIGYVWLGAQSLVALVTVPLMIKMSGRRTKSLLSVKDSHA